MWKFIVLLIIALGAVILFQHQDVLLQKAEVYLKKEKVISKVNAASAQKENYIKDAEQKALEY
ncbi:hypothetical protein J6S88_01455 [bacterium]|nr:hypothetical protein [bacterium]